MISSTVDLRELIIKTEENLRDLVYSVLTREYGMKWELDPQLGWSNDKRKTLERRLEGRRKEFPTKKNPFRLIDYCYILDLKQLITKNDKHFKVIFSDLKKYFLFFDELGKHRDPIMHGTNVLEEHEKDLCRGICGEFNAVIGRWRNGYARKIFSYSCDMSFDVLEMGDKKHEQTQAFKIAQDHIDKIKTLSKR